MKKIAVLTGTRAEYGLLKPVIKRISEDNALQLCLIVTGMHLSAKYGFTFHEIENDGFHIDCKVDMNLDNNTPYGISCAMAEEMEGLAGAFEKEKPDFLVLLGDRYEVEMAAVTAMMFGIPIAHIHGGELTEGAIDDGIRHAVTKMSMLHFTSTQEYANRVIQMGEEPKRVFYVGALGSENIKKQELYSREELCEKFGQGFKNSYLLITYHPVTLEHGQAKEQFDNLLKSLSDLEDYVFIFTYANADAEGAVINQMIEDYTRKFPEKAYAFVSMGQKGYLSALKYCSAVVGNSSSGIIEAPSFHVPTINIGKRQTGRVMADTVISCGNSCEEIKNALSTALGQDFRNHCRISENPYEKEGTSERIVEEIKNYLDKKPVAGKKFYDIAGFMF